MLNMPSSAEGHTPHSLIVSHHHVTTPLPTYFRFRRHFDFAVVGVYRFQKVNNSFNLFPVTYVPSLED
jgi:hypothetical protein